MLSFYLQSIIQNITGILQFVQNYFGQSSGHSLYRDRTVVCISITLWQVKLMIGCPCMYIKLVKITSFLSVHCLCSNQCVWQCSAASIKAFLFIAKVKRFKQGSVLFHKLMPCILWLALWIWTWIWTWYRLPPDLLRQSSFFQSVFILSFLTMWLNQLNLSYIIK